MININFEVQIVQEAKVIAAALNTVFAVMILVVVNSKYRQALGPRLVPVVEVSMLYPTSAEVGSLVSRCSCHAEAGPEAWTLVMGPAGSGAVTSSGPRPAPGSSV